jgi:16S rRNA (guanine527-N7)-methyltransferase
MTGDGPVLVSRETSRVLFGSRFSLAEAYADILRTDGIRRGLIGPREAARTWERHILNCVAIAPALPVGATVVDLGSGAGLPGLVLAIARPDLRVQLVEPLARRSSFLTETAARLGLADVQVVRERAENLHGRVAADVVTARAVARFDQLARWSLPLVRPGGALLAIKGERAREELNAAAPGLAALQAQSWQLETYVVDDVDPPTRVIRVVRREA